MDKSLERIISLLPRTPDGRIVHGAKRSFCEKIGAPHNIFSQWEKGVSRSYRNYFYQISNVYNVSTDYLLCKTNDPTPLQQKEKPTPISEGKLSDEEKELIRLYDLAAPELQAAALAVLRSAEAQHNIPDDDVTER